MMYALVPELDEEKLVYALPPELDEGKDMDVPKSVSSNKIPKFVDVPESESSAKRRKMDARLIAPVLPSYMVSPSAYLQSDPHPIPRLTSIKIYLREDGSFSQHDPKFEKGTTALAFGFIEGIIVAVDFSSKSSKHAKNVVELNSHMLATISGGSEFLLEELQKKCHQQELMEGKKTSVEQALKWLADALSACKEELSIGILIAMCNETEHGLYHMNGKGKLVEDDVLATGSGSSAIALLKNELRVYAPFFRTPYDLRCRCSKRDMTITEAADLAKRAICTAAYRAPQCGDTYIVYHLGTSGCNKLFEDDIKEWQKENLKPGGWKYEVVGKGWSEA